MNDIQFRRRLNLKFSKFRVPRLRGFQSPFIRLYQAKSNQIKPKHPTPHSQRSLFVVGSLRRPGRRSSPLSGRRFSSSDSPTLPRDFSPSLTHHYFHPFLRQWLHRVLRPQTPVCVKLCFERGPLVVSWAAHASDFGTQQILRAADVV